MLEYYLNKCSNITKKHITKKSRNSKFQEKYYINKKTHLATEKSFVLHNSLKINKRGGGVLISSAWGGGSKKIEKLISVPPLRLLGT